MINAIASRLHVQPGIQRSVSPARHFQLQSNVSSSSQARFSGGLPRALLALAVAAVVAADRGRRNILGLPEQTRVAVEAPVATGGGRPRNIDEARLITISTLRDAFGQRARVDLKNHNYQTLGTAIKWVNGDIAVKINNEPEVYVLNAQTDRVQVGELQ